MSGIAFACDIDLTTLVLWIFLHEIVQEHVEIISDISLTPSKRLELSDEAETRAERLINEHHVGMIVPSILIFGQLKWLFYVLFVVMEVKWALLGIEPKHR